MEEGYLLDASKDPAFSMALLQAVGQQQRFQGSEGALAAFPGPAFRPWPEPAEAGAELTLVPMDQSNTSVQIGDRLFLKMFRRVEDGIHPELEIGQFLLEKAGFPHVPPLAGTLRYLLDRGEPMLLAVLQGFVANQGDAWQMCLEALGRYFVKALSQPSPWPDLNPPQQSLVDLALGDIPPLAQEMLGPLLESMRLLGQRTAELHLALASATDDPDFAPESATNQYHRSRYQATRSETRKALDLLRHHLPVMTETGQQEARTLLGLEGKILKRLQRILERKITVKRIRCHGNYRLTSVLWTGKDFVLIDFEGDPTRSLQDRRRKRSAIRDLASMIQSFHWVAAVALQEKSVRPEDIPLLEPWAAIWPVWVSIAFLKAYLEKAGTANFVPQPREDLVLLLDYYLLRRMMYVLRLAILDYPDQVPIPLQGILTYLKTPD